jgi:hypothetical protein
MGYLLIVLHCSYAIFYHQTTHQWNINLQLHSFAHLVRNVLKNCLTGLGALDFGKSGDCRNFKVVELYFGNDSTCAMLHIGSEGFGAVI